MSVAIAIGFELADPGEPGCTTRLVVIEINPVARSTEAGQTPAGRWVWRTHDTPPVWVSAGGKPESPPPQERGPGDGPRRLPGPAPAPSAAPAGTAALAVHQTTPRVVDSGPERRIVDYYDPNQTWEDAEWQ